MPEGYKCDWCGSFSKYTHAMTEVDIGRAAAKDGTVINTTYVLCPSCATNIRELIRDVDVPEKARESAL